MWLSVRPKINRQSIYLPLKAVISVNIDIRLSPRSSVARKPFKFNRVEINQNGRSLSKHEIKGV